MREYHHEALDRADRMAAPPFSQEAAEAAQMMRDVLAESMKSFMEQWKIQHEASTAAGSTALQQMKACSDSLGKSMQAWAEMMYGG